MKKIIILSTIAAAAISCCNTSTTQNIEYGQKVTLSREVMQDKIKGGWVGQTIGCTYGGPTEFKYKGAIINDKAPIVWYDDYIYDTYILDPGLYDDIYMDLTFLEIMQHEGIDAPAMSYANAFANADYKLWHANQAARYNILNGLTPPESGHWINNPHADDIDFQIEADFIGMICPGMPNRSSMFADEIGHIMNYGDGWYGGVFVGALYSLAFVIDDIPTLIHEALKTIPENTKYRNCMEDVIKYHALHPEDWRLCWLEIEKRHSYDVGCPEGVMNGFSIDAVINSAYVLMGLLYGEGDFLKTMDISTRCGQDSDCNPSTAAGVLGVMYGYNAIPNEWTNSIDKIADFDFPYTSLTLNETYQLNLKLMEDVVIQAGGTVTEQGITFTTQEPQAVAWEQSFEGIEPTERRVLKIVMTDEATVDFNGNGIVAMGEVRKLGIDKDNSYVALIDAYIDGEKVEQIKMPYDYIKRKYDIFHIYNLPKTGKHTLTLKWRNPNNGYVIDFKEMVVYSPIK